MPNDIKKLKRLMYAANHLKKENPVILKGRKITSSQALKYAWWFESFRDQLRTGVVTFSYFKIDGGIREAKGTLNGVLIPAEDLPKSGADNSSSGARSKNSEFATVAYYDLDARGWRSFRIDLFIGFVTCYKLEESGLAKREKDQKRNYQR